MTKNLKWILGGVGVIGLYFLCKKCYTKQPIIANTNDKNDIVNEIVDGSPKFNPEKLLLDVQTVTNTWWNARKPNNLGTTREIVTGDNVGIPAMDLGQYPDTVKLLDNEYKKNIDLFTAKAFSEGYILKRKDNAVQEDLTGRNAVQFTPKDNRMLPPTYTISKA